MPVIGYLFPGPGTATPGLGRDLYNKVIPVRSAMDKADKVFAEEGFKVTKACFLGTAEEMARPSVAGPALLALAFGICEALKGRRVLPLMAAGYGGMELAALACLGAIPYDEALKLSRRRGALIEQAWSAAPFHVASVVGIPLEELKKKFEPLPKKPEIISEDSPDACVVAGPEDLLKRVVPLLASKTVKCSAVYSGAGWPRASMAPAAPGIESAAAGIKAERSGPCELYSATEGGRVADWRGFGALLGKAVHEPLRFADCAASMRKAGCDTVVEIGPGEALGGFFRRQDTGVRALGTQDTKSLAVALKLAV